MKIDFLQKLNRFLMSFFYPKIQVSEEEFDVMIEEQVIIVFKKGLISNLKKIFYSIYSAFLSTFKMSASEYH